jgi:hypothetical protein
MVNVGQSEQWDLWSRGPGVWGPLGEMWNSGPEKIGYRVEVRRSPHQTRQELPPGLGKLRGMRMRTKKSHPLSPGCDFFVKLIPKSGLTLHQQEVFFREFYLREHL